jgi:DMSO reductase anchor subunit
VLGLRTSWLSREALVLGLFAAQAAGAAAHSVLAPDEQTNLMLTRTTAAVGLVGVFCSVMVYAATGRAHWSARRTAQRFFAGLLLLGAAGMLALQPLSRAPVSQVPALASAMLGVALLQMLGAPLAKRAARRAGERRERRLLDSLAPLVRLRWAGLAVGGLVGPLLLLCLDGPAPTLVAYLSFACLLVSELCDRHLFFAAAPPSRMPGGLK